MGILTGTFWRQWFGQKDSNKWNIQAPRRASVDNFLGQDQFSTSFIYLYIPKYSDYLKVVKQLLLFKKIKLVIWLHRVLVETGGLLSFGFWAP